MTVGEGPPVCGSWPVGFDEGEVEAGTVYGQIWDGNQVARLWIGSILKIIVNLKIEMLRLFQAAGPTPTGQWPMLETKGGFTCLLSSETLARLSPS